MSQLPPQIEFISIDLLKPYPRNARVHSRKQVRQIASSIQRFGFTNPVLISDEREIIAGHGRVLAARELAMESVPTIRLRISRLKSAAPMCSPITSWLSTRAGIASCSPSSFRD